MNGINTTVILMLIAPIIIAAGVSQSQIFHYNYPLLSKIIAFIFIFLGVIFGLMLNKKAFHITFKNKIENFEVFRNYLKISSIIFLLTGSIIWLGSFLKL